MQDAQRTPLAAFVFDAYGTLFDVQSLAATAEALAPGHGADLSRIWRAKQLEYTWLQTLMAGDGFHRGDFDQVTAAALDYAIAALVLPLTNADRRSLCDAWLTLPAFSDALPMLATLAPRPRAILSNGTLAMLEPVIRHNGLHGHLDAVLSVESAGRFKPAPEVYALAQKRLGVPAGKIGFVSANAWDAIGARAYGFTSFWINRAEMPLDRHGPAPDFILGSLAELPSLAPA